jgi:hypothetical protein
LGMFVSDRKGHWFEFSAIYFRRKKWERL